MKQHTTALLIIALVLTWGSAATAEPDTLHISWATVQEIYLLLRIGPLQLTAEQCEAILGIIDAGQPEENAELARKVLDLRMRLLAGEAPTAADKMLLREASGSLRPRRGEQGQTQDTVIDQIAEQLTTEQLGMLVGTNQRAAIFKPAADSRAAKVVVGAIVVAFKSDDAAQREAKLQEIATGVKDVAGEALDEGMERDLDDFFTRLGGMDLTEVTEKQDELLAELEILLPTETDPTALSLALDRETVRKMVGSAFLNAMCRPLLQARLDYLTDQP